MKAIGIDIGSTSAKTVVLDEKGMIEEAFVLPTGWSSFEALKEIEKRLREKGISVEENACVSTGYGREAVGFAQKKVTEITCHAGGGAFLFGEAPMVLIDIGGQDTKVIACEKGRVESFFMNDKCAAGTGKFIEVMANRLQMPIHRLDQIAGAHTKELSISSLCTVFAESEVVALVGQGHSKENIAWGILKSVVKKVKQEYNKLSIGDRQICLTGGMCENEVFLKMMEEEFKSPVKTTSYARYAGAIGAARIAGKGK